MSGVTGAVGLSVGLAWPRWRREPALVAGLAATLAAAVAMNIARLFQIASWPD
ncbi:MAG TPA: hypothetical protein VJ935_08805 [Acidimicrobiia bacterium]|nr:hypothetical protein [Acidimicrobiia bacterium]